MLRWLRRAVIVLFVIAALVGTVLFAALRDNPARPAKGERKIVAGSSNEIHYYASGAPSARAVALIPSFARSASDFNELVSSLNRGGYRTLAMQPRGIDGSELPGLQGTLHAYAMDLKAVLDAEGVTEPAVIIGHAFGNRIARTFGSDFPGRTRGLILLSAGGSEPAPPEASNKVLLAMLRIAPEARRRQAISEAFFAPGISVPDYWIRGWYPMAGIAEQIAGAATPYEEWGAGGNGPILVLQPEDDALAPDAGKRLQAGLPGRVEVHELPRTGHAILPERPSEVAKIVLRFLAALR